MILADTHKGAIEFGPDFTTMDSMPSYENESEVGTNHVWEDYDKDMFPFPGSWDTDSRLCLRATAPRPATVLAVTTAMTVHDKT
jgi:hypothetical protein